MAGGWHPGDAVLWRSVVLGRVRWAIPHTLVAAGDRVVLYVRPGVVGRRPRVAFLDDFEQIRRGRWEHERHVWHSHHVLRLTPRGAQALAEPLLGRELGLQGLVREPPGGAPAFPARLRHARPTHCV